MSFVDELMSAPVEERKKRINDIFCAYIIPGKESIDGGCNELELVVRFINGDMKRIDGKFSDIAIQGTRFKGDYSVGVFKIWNGTTFYTSIENNTIRFVETRPKRNEKRKKGVVRNLGKSSRDNE